VNKAVVGGRGGKLGSRETHEWEEGVQRLEGGVPIREHQQGEGLCTNGGVNAVSTKTEVVVGGEGSRDELVWQTGRAVIWGRGCMDTGEGGAKAEGTRK